MPTVDFGRHSDDYAAFRPGPPPSFYERLDDLVGIEGKRVLDLATGPGTVALELAARGATATGIDVAEGQIAAARRVAAERGLADRTTFDVARAEATGLGAESVDLVTAGQCWHWLDGPATLAEVRRVLRPGGALAIIHFSYLAPHSPVAHDTEALVLELNPTWGYAGQNGLYPNQIDDVIRGGLTLVEAFCYDHDQPFSHAAWRGRMRTCNGVGSGGMTPEDVGRFDARLATLLANKYPDPVAITHRVWCVVAKKPE